jgi:hypothetical protein
MAGDLIRNVIDVETFAPFLLDKDEPRSLEAQTLELTGRPTGSAWRSTSRSASPGSRPSQCPPSGRPDR